MLAPHFTSGLEIGEDRVQITIGDVRVVAGACIGTFCVTSRSSTLSPDAWSVWVGLLSEGGTIDAPSVTLPAVEGQSQAFLLRLPSPSTVIWLRVLMHRAGWWRCFEAGPRLSVPLCRDSRDRRLLRRLGATAAIAAMSGRRVLPAHVAMC